LRVITESNIKRGSKGKINPPTANGLNTGVAARHPAMNMMGVSKGIFGRNDPY